ncbi:hypothetical protein B0A48_00636 [Cryoendolithus antarcticus]|uniref:Uncharacterized protein n=1 Tax=Cryoendolithus antarcticus TaxID=1507870 RepID=A0A1V8TVA6_9PEZI|nr:hypothetical protein B0A48_00636 [Cryoendolithus antarcticus]
MAFRRHITVPAHSFTTHELTIYGEAHDIGRGHIFHDQLNCSFTTQPFDSVYVCHPLVPIDVEGMEGSKLRELHRRIRECQRERRSKAGSEEINAREKSLKVVRKKLGRMAVVGCVMY